MPRGSVNWVHVLSTAGPPEQGLQVRVGMVFDVSAPMQLLLSLLPCVVNQLYVEPDGRHRYGFVSDYVRTLYIIELAAVRPTAMRCRASCLTRWEARSPCAARQALTAWSGARLPRA